MKIKDLLESASVGSMGTAAVGASTPIAKGKVANVIKRGGAVKGGKKKPAPNAQDSKGSLLA